MQPVRIGQSAATEQVLRGSSSDQLVSRLRDFPRLARELSGHKLAVYSVSIKDISIEVAAFQVKFVCGFVAF